MKKIIFSLIVLSLLTGGYIVLAEDNNLPSPRITPDNPFYFLKTWKETIQNFFTFGAENKAKQFLHLADVRLAEYQKMIDKGKTEIAQKTLEKYEKQLNHALQKIEELKNKGKDIKDVSQKLENTVGKHIEVLEKNLEKAPEAAKEGLENAIENSSKVIEKIGGKTKKEKSCIDSGGTVSTSLCCKEVSDFPNLCFIGACGCALEESHQIKICDCGTDKCFDGEKCVAKEVAEDETANWKTYRNEEYGFEVKYPLDFTEQKAESDTTLLKITKIDRGSSYYFGIHVIKNYKINQIVSKVGEVKEINIGDHLGYEYFYIEGAGMSEVALIQIGQDALSISFDCIGSGQNFATANDRKIYVQNFLNQILSTFRFLE